MCEQRFLLNFFKVVYTARLGGFGGGSGGVEFTLVRRGGGGGGGGGRGGDDDAARRQLLFYYGGRDSCHGDSGSPLWKWVGVSRRRYGRTSNLTQHLSA